MIAHNPNAEKVKAVSGTTMSESKEPFLYSDPFLAISIVVVLVTHFLMPIQRIGHISFAIGLLCLPAIIELLCMLFNRKSKFSRRRYFMIMAVVAALLSFSNIYYMYDMSENPFKYGIS